MKCECGKHASFGKEGEKAMRCATHKKDGDIRVTYLKKCEYPGCTIRPTLGKEGEKALRCATHKKAVSYTHLTLLTTPYV